MVRRGENGMPLSFLAPRQNAPLNVIWKEALLTAESCRQVVAYCERLTPQTADMTGPQVSDARQSIVAWLPEQKESAALFNLVRGQVQAINQEHFGFDLIGFGEHMQYAKYGASKGHYDWHVDAGPGVTSLRKLAVIVQLSDQAEYDGGDVEFQGPGPAVRLPRKQGTLGVFSTFFLHRVTAVTRGERKSLVAWVTGPPFR